MSAAKSLDIYKTIDFQLRIESGPDAGKGFRILPPKISLGRDPRNQIVVSDPKASRKQLSIQLGENIILTDHSTRKTTCVNGQSVQAHTLVPGDIITFGTTKIRFVAKSKIKQPAVQKPGSMAKPGKGQAAMSSPGAMTMGLPGGAKAKKGPKPAFIIIVLLLVASVIFLMTAETTSKKEQELTSEDELQKQIEDSQANQKRMKEVFAEKKKQSQDDYLANVEQHFIRGFRDFQSKNYTRALQSFSTVIAKDPTHEKALIYGRLAKQRRDELIDKHLLAGELYKSKLMYGRCAAEFEKATVLMSQPTHTKYKLAKERFQECSLLKKRRGL